MLFRYCRGVLGCPVMTWVSCGNKTDPIKSNRKPFYEIPTGFAKIVAKWFPGYTESIENAEIIRIRYA